MPSVISDKSIFDAVSPQPVTKAGPLTDTWRLTASQPLDPANRTLPGIEIFQDQINASASVALRLNRDYKWVRLEQSINPGDLDIGRYRIALTYQYTADKPAQTPRLKIIEYKDGVGQTYLNIAQDLPVTTTPKRVEFLVAATAQTYPDRQYRFCIEMAKTGTLNLLDLEIIHIDGAIATDIPGLPPYRLSDLPVNKSLSSLNDSMDSGLRKNPQGWLPKMLSVAVGLEDYETAWGICKYIRAQHRHDRTLIETTAPKMLHTALALGEIEEAKEMMREFSVLGLCPNASIQLSRNLGETGVKSVSYQFPSGETDVFSLNRALERGGQLSFGEMVSLSLPATEAALIWANYQRQFDDESYLLQLNTYLDSFDSPFKITLGEHRENILNRVSFIKNKTFTGMTHGPLVSIIVAAFRSEATIEYAIRSLLHQTYQDIEILVADDCSDDATSERLREFADDPRVRIYRGTENQGPYNIRNHLIAEARGDIITFHDADDVALPHRISKQLAEMTRHQAKVVLGSWLRIKENGHIVAFRDGRFLRNCLNSIMFVRSIYDQFGPYRSILCGADSEFYEQLRGRLPASEIVTVRQPLVLGLWSSSSLTRTAGIEADEAGYRAPARRAYAAAIGRQRVLGKTILPDQKIEEITRAVGIYRAPKGLISITS